MPKFNLFHTFLHAIVVTNRLFTMVSTAKVRTVVKPIRRSSMKNFIQTCRHDSITCILFSLGQGSKVCERNKKN